MRALGTVYRLGVPAASGAEVSPVGGQPRRQPSNLRQQAEPGGGRQGVGNHARDKPQVGVHGRSQLLRGDRRLQTSVVGRRTGQGQDDLVWVVVCGCGDVARDPDAGAGPERVLQEVLAVHTIRITTTGMSESELRVAGGLEYRPERCSVFGAGPPDLSALVASDRVIIKCPGALGVLVQPGVHRLGQLGAGQARVGSRFDGMRSRAARSRWFGSDIPTPLTLAAGAPLQGTGQHRTRSSVGSMRCRSSGSLVTVTPPTSRATRATEASTTSAVPVAAHNCPTARDSAPSSG